LDKTIELTKRLEPDVVHFAMWGGEQILWFLKEYSKAVRELSIPIVYTLHEVFPHMASDEERKRFLDSYIYANHLVVLTEDARRDAEKLRIPVTVIPHGNYHSMDRGVVDRKRAREIIGEKLGIEIDDRTNVVGFFGFIRKYKGLIYLIRSAPRVLERFPNTIFFAIGSIELDEDPLLYKGEVKSLGLEGRFFFYTKYVEGQEFFESIFKSSNVMVYPYVDVSQSGAMITSISMKCPVIISEIGSFIDELKRKGVILTAEPGNPESIADEIIWILEDWERAKKLAERAYKVFEEEYSWRRIAREYVEIFKDISATPSYR
jgi:glycosyltransferase involved in cell wall biosynthesis